MLVTVIIKIDMIKIKNSECNCANVIPLLKTPLLIFVKYVAGKVCPITDANPSKELTGSFSPEKLIVGRSVIIAVAPSAAICVFAKDENSIPIPVVMIT